MTIQLGHTYKDKITGCHQVLLSPPAGKDGGAREVHWFDEQRVELNKGSKQITLDNSKTPGFDKPAPKR